MSLSRALGAIGRTLITAGVLVLLFVAYQLWGTGLHESRAQHSLEHAFEARLHPSTSTTTTRPGSEPAAPTTTTPPPPPSSGDAVAHLVIPKIGVDKFVVEGVGVPDLKRGPGHYPGTPMPGQPGNAAIAGHRTTYGAPFYRINELAAGDEVLVTTDQGTFKYRVTGQQIVKPSQVEVLADKGDNRLTLTSCHPRYSAAQRIVVTSELVDEPATPTTTAPPVTTPEGKVKTPPRRATAFEDQGLSGEGAPALPAILWGLGAAAIWVFAWLAGRRWRRWVAYLVAAPAFFVVLFVFFENFSRLLPANF
jgi:sortase A